MATQLASEPRGAPLERESTASLFSRLLTDVTSLLRNEVALAKAEFRETVHNIKVGSTSLAIGAAVLLGGVLALLASAILALAQVVAPWLSALIIGAALVIVGMVMLNTAKKKLQPSNLDLDRTRMAVRQDVEVIARRT